MTVKKAVIAVAGYGTRFLPATKAVPKELLSIVDKPIVQYLVEEAVQSGIEEIILVTQPGSAAIEDHFDSSRALEAHLSEKGDDRNLELIRSIPRLADFAYVRQAAHLPYGNGSPLLAARGFIGRNEPFVYMFGDDLVLSEKPCLLQLIELFEQHNPAAVIAFQEVPDSETHLYGIAKLKPDSDPKEMERIVEKPKRKNAPSNLAQIGRFVFTPEIIDILERIDVSSGQELYLTEAIDRLCAKKPVLVHTIEGQWYTTGDPLRCLMANVAYGLRDKTIGEDFRQYLQSLDLTAP